MRLLPPLMPPLMAVFLLGSPLLARAAEPAPVASWAEPSPVAVSPADGDGEAKYPDYVVGGIVSLAAGAAFVGGGLVAAATEHPKTALGLAALGTTGLAVGVPLVLLGGADRQPADSAMVGTGTAVATPGVIGLGMGITILSERLAADDEPEMVLPLVLMGVGAAVAVTGIIIWAGGAGPAEQSSARLSLGPTSATLQGTF
jgi:hypothetical protein